MSTRAGKQQKRAVRKKKRDRAPKRVAKHSGPRCGLCGATENLTRTECCNQWICDDEHEYQLFSYARNSCHRNHDRYTLCSIHFNEGHAGDWKDCKKCRKATEPEMYVYYGTNEYNFEVLENPPKYDPTRCADCDAIIVLSDGGYSHSISGYRCFRCSASEFAALGD